MLFSGCCYVCWVCIHNIKIRFLLALLPVASESSPRNRFTALLAAQTRPTYSSADPSLIAIQLVPPHALRRRST
jgi:hypothetical protein